MGGAPVTDWFEVPPPETSRFRIRRPLGAGGMGVVFEALDLLRGTTVALKVVRRLGPEALLRFKAEFRALQDLQHPNLIRLDELICDGDQWFFTMECLDGVDFLAYVAAPDRSHELAVSHTLDEGTENGGDRSAATLGVPAPAPSRLTEGRWFDETRLRSALAQLVQGLTALHAAGKVHRDIKPPNTLVTRDGRVVLLDFGVIADVRGGPDGHAVGTPLYMAPEQIGPATVGPPADWYAVGLLLYQALTGRLPFGTSPLQTLALKQHLEPARPTSLAAGVPEDLDRLCMDLLRIDPAERPDDMEMLQRLSLRRAGPWLQPGFVGRRRELGELEACFSAVRRGEARTLLIDGESGAGKTALLGKFIEGLDARAVVLAGRCCERESVPYKAVDEAVDALSWYLKRLPPTEAALLLPPHAAALAQLFPVLQRVALVAEAMPARDQPVEPRELRLRAFAALRELFAGIARSSPLVLAIDDLQWADTDSLALLTELVSPPAPTGLLVIATVRSSGGHAHPAADPPLLPEARRLQLTGLAPEEARELAASLLSRAQVSPDDRATIAAMIAEESGGHPLFLDELVRRKLVLANEPATPHLEDALAARVAALDADERAVLELVAVASVPLVWNITAAAAGVGFDELARRVASLRAAKLISSAVTTAGAAIEPYHDRVRRVVIAGVAPARQRELHLRLAETLEQHAGDAETLAVHFQEAGDARKAARHAIVAANRAAAALAFDRAASLFRVAAASERPGTPEGQRLRVALAEALSNAGHCAEAARAFEEAAVGADGASAVTLQQRAAEQYLRAGHIDAGVAAVSRVLAPLGLALPGTPRRALASLVIRRALLRLRGLRYRERAAGERPEDELTRIDACYLIATNLGIVDHVRGADFQTRHVLWALRAGEPYRVARALTVEAGYAATRGVRGRARAERLLRVAGELAARLDHPYALALVDCFTGLTGLLTGDWRLTRDRCASAGKLWRERCLGVSWELDTNDWILLSAVYDQGDLAEVARRVPVLLRGAEARGDLYAATNLRTSFMPRIRLMADQPLEARREGAQAVRAWSKNGFHLQHYNFEILAEGYISPYLGQAADAHQRIVKMWPRARASLFTLIQRLRIFAIHTRARCALAAASTARGATRTDWLRAAQRDTRRLAREHAAWSRGWVDLLASGIAAARGDLESAATLAGIAAQRCDAADMALHAAAARRRLGELLQGDAGHSLTGAADAWMVTQGIRNPRRWTAVLAPGFPGD